MNLGGLDLAILVGYFGLIVWLGLWTGRRNRDTEDYFVGGRNMPGWLVGVSIMGTCISSVTYVAYPGKSFSKDWQYLVQGLTLPLVLVCGGFLVVGFYRKHVKVTVNELLEKRFGPGVRVFSVIFLLSSEIARIASVLYLFGLVVKTISGLPIEYVILAIGIVTIAYAVVGGIQGVIWTDLIQSGVLVLGGLITVVAVSLSVDGGFSAVVSEAWSQDKMKLLDFSGGLSQDTFWVLVVSGVVNFFYFLAGNQNQVQRYQCVSTDREALKATIIGSVGSVPVWILFMLVGTCLFVYYQHADPGVSGAVADLKSDEVFPHFIVTGLPAGLSGLLLAGLFGAAMSSLDSSMNASSTLFVTDIWRRFFRPGIDDRAALKTARLLTLIWGVIGVSLALAMIRTQVFLNFYFKIVSLVIGGITGIVFLALVSKRAHGRGVMAGIISGLGVMAWGIADMSGWLNGGLSALRFPWHGIMVGVVTTLVVIVVGYLASMVMAPGNETKGSRDEQE
jgi:SSS family solute:Na+ symporter